MDPRHRLHRRYPGEGIADPTSLHGRLAARDKEPPKERALAGQLVRPLQVNSRRASRLADPHPNAPLLIRIVRWPYALETFRGQRKQVFEALTLEERTMEPVPFAMRLGQDFRGEFPWGGPVRNQPVRVVVREPIPSVDSWLDDTEREK